MGLIAGQVKNRFWLTRVLLWEIVGAIVMGALAGWLAGKVLVWAYRQPSSESHSTNTIGLALALTVLAAVRLMGSDGILAVFVASLMLNRFVSKRETRHEHVQEAIGRFFDLPVFVLMGIMLPWGAWADLGWGGIVFAVLVLLLRRLPWWLAMRPLVPGMRHIYEAAFLGWFGPIGVASIYYALLSRHMSGLEQVWPVASLVVSLSVVVHGNRRHAADAYHRRAPFRSRLEAASAERRIRKARSTPSCRESKLWNFQDMRPE